MSLLFSSNELYPKDLSKPRSDTSCNDPDFARHQYDRKFDQDRSKPAYVNFGHTTHQNNNTDFYNINNKCYIRVQNISEYIDK